MLGFELTVALLCILLITLPIAAWAALRRISAGDQIQNKKEELHAIENSISLMIREIQDSVEGALDNMEKAAEKLNQMIDKADDRIRQLEYYYEYGDELKPLVQPNHAVMTSQAQTVETPHIQSHALKHKEVHELSRKGWSSSQIARHTGMSSDEVQLIVNLMEISTVEPQKPPHLSDRQMM